MATIEIDDKKLEVQAGQMIIEVADDQGINIPRFCYHKHLTVAANCRMCLVEVEKMRGPVPACATPVTDGMKIYTKSPTALAAQKSVMEFLLINHPLDCPICDQGGECELQDVSMGYGGDVSNYTEGKRSVDDEDIGSLISTEMTRCIHCTRCVRFGEEVAGVRELGATGRGENMKIGTYIKHSLKSEVSGNVIDLCPVGALTSKPFRFQARAWELQQRDTVAAHDCLGSNIHIHTRRQEVMRAVPRENPAINQTWISDRDRFSYVGTKSSERVAKPLIKQNGQWQETDWETALTHAALGIKRAIKQHGAERVGALASPNSTTEEFYLLQKMLRDLGSHNIDHRLHQMDFTDQLHAGLAPVIDSPISDMRHAQATLLVGSNIQKEQPVAAIHLRHSCYVHEGKVMAINAFDYDTSFDLSEQILVSPQHFCQQLAEVAKCLVTDSSSATLLADVVPSEASLAIAKHLQTSENAYIILGSDAQNHPQAAVLRSLAGLIAKLANAKLVMMTDGANSAGAWVAGAIPHRSAAGKASKKVGLDAKAMIEEKLAAYLLLGIEPERDCNNPSAAIAAMQNADFVVLCSAYKTPKMLEYADAILPIVPFTETSGSYINIANDWQVVNACTKPFGEARPAWKVLRVLGNLFDLSGFEYLSSEDVRDELQKQLEKSKFENPEAFLPKALPKADTEKLYRLGAWGIYDADAVVRRSQPLQEAASNNEHVIYVSNELAKRYNLRQGKDVTAMQNGGEATMRVCITDKIADNTVYLNSGFAETAVLGEAYGEIELK